jgi:hypothetical protein
MKYEVGFNLLVLGAILAGTYGLVGVGVQSPIQQGHVEANVPPNADFHGLLRRDLQDFFEHQGESFNRLEYELLRKEATQVGVGFPKFYVWIRLVRTSGVTIEGAARVASQDRTNFRVTDFVTQEQIAADPSMVSSIFPEEVANIIRRR